MDAAVAAAPADLAPPAAAPAAPGPAPARATPDDGERAHLRPVAPPAVLPAAPAGQPAAHPQRASHDAPNGETGLRPTCTTAQLRRFIKSRPWVPMHELRRRFGISGADDDVTPIRVSDRRLYVGLPPAEGRMVAELLSGGDVGYELSLDPDVPVVVGVYPMRPVPRS